MIDLTRLSAIVVMLVLLSQTRVLGRVSDTTAVVAVTLATAGRAYEPGAKIAVTHLAIVHEYALSIYAQGGSGGEIVLKKVRGAWTVLGRGGGRMNADIVSAFGVPPDIAGRLVALVAEKGARAGVSRARVVI